MCDNGGIDRVDAGKKTFDHWKKNLRVCTLNIVQLKSLICTIFAGLGNLNMQFAWDLKCFGLESLVCTVLAASWSQHLCYAGDYLQYFVVCATYCLKLAVLGSISAWFRVFVCEYFWLILRHLYS